MTVKRLNFGHDRQLFLPDRLERIRKHNAYWRLKGYRLVCDCYNAKVTENKRVRCSHGIAIEFFEAQEGAIEAKCQVCDHYEEA
jgi:hypothetical protein